MRTRSSLLALLPTLFLLTGCPVWMNEGSEPLPSAECRRDRDCAADYSCQSGFCVANPECSGPADCGAGSQCDAGSCVPLPECVTDSQCTASHRCDVDTCVPRPSCGADKDCGPTERCTEQGYCAERVACSGDQHCREGDWCHTDGFCRPPIAPNACRNDGDCRDGNVCVQDFCRDPESVCQFNHQCGAATSGAPRACVNNGCSPICEEDADCQASGLRCDSGYCVDDRPSCNTSAECEGGQACVLWRCVDECAGTHQCPAAEDVCVDDGYCRPRWEPTPLCLDNGDCAAGSDCVGGVCRAPCPAAPQTCLNVDVQLTHCNTATGYCEAESERTPQCFASSDCQLDEHCVNAVCRRL